MSGGSKELPGTQEMTADGRPWDSLSPQEKLELRASRMPGRNQKLLEWGRGGGNRPIDPETVFGDSSTVHSNPDHPLRPPDEFVRNQKIIGEQLDKGNMSGVIQALRVLTGEVRPEVNAAQTLALQADTKAHPLDEKKADFVLEDTAREVKKEFGDGGFSGFLRRLRSRT